MIDWGQITFEDKVRQQFVDIDFRTEVARNEIRKSGYTWRSFEKTYDTTWIYHENGLEGIVLSHAEIRNAVENEAISDMTIIPTCRYIRAHKKCIEQIREKALSKRSEIDIEFIKDLHRLLLMDSNKGGVYRKDIPIHRTYFQSIAEGDAIEGQLEEALMLLNSKREKDLHPVEFASNFHFKFMGVFPFSKHSGTIGRLLLNFILIREEYIPIVIHSTDRHQYYDALNSDEKNFCIFLCDVMTNSLENVIKFFDSPSSQVKFRHG